ncbi:MAG: FAD-binding oxidoreductase [Ignavibacteriales bacterium]|nr:FAD-binding oxidoreductase [Ignavibacteriales bacterium]
MTTTFESVELELRSLVKGDCFFDAQTREQYSRAASWYEILPVGVVFPKDEVDVQKVIQFCAENNISVIPRGGGTGLAGQAVGMGIVLDFTRHMKAIRGIRSSAVDVQPGVVLEDLNERLRLSQAYFPVDPVSGKLCTIGGMIATNAAGPHGVKYGSMKDHVESLRVVFADGTVADIDGKPPLANSHLAGIFAVIETLLMPNKKRILRRFPNVAKNSSGYNLKDAVGGKTLDLRKLLVGSEGTLAVVVGARLKLSRLPQAHVGAVAHFSDYSSMVEATIRGLELHPSAIEVMDRTYFLLGEGFSPSTDALIDKKSTAMLYFEFEGDSEKDLEPALPRLTEVLKPCKPLSFSSLKSEEEMRNLFELREAVSKRLNLEDTFGKSSFIEDVAVPVHNMPLYIEELSRILSKFGIRFSIYGHAGSGNIHCGTFVDLKEPQQFRAIDRVAGEIADLAVSLGGTLSGEHGDGFVRTPFLERLYGTEVYALFGRVKEIFDPLNILNPGKIVGPQNISILHDISFA